ncbi:hypothetical protein EYZ11_005743 [Aspergillus tanneri]|uniref:NmrA-like family domain-containing protein 1 n=1 Tax=Aspergillus tanneri TaxID=1220188 RepID=A0A4S3JJL0_9EURO|nr:uncharacterized protein ATNIH1004_004211 [Aspergillus tanneri]KAA8648326.1 hypothetical protein ATNIH1004_004211 [Aspergillus tanneri]THC94797.1 hypothetical protein EYZ11_005743 [Aspergillus tanneri]
MSKLITVFGATGNQGGSVIRAIQADPVLNKEYKIRGVTRDVNKAAAKALAEKGVEVVSADMSSATSLTAAIEGSHTVFLVTNFWESFSKDTEVQQGKSVTDASKAAGVQHLIFSSLRNVTEISGGRLRHVTHFDGKAEVEAYIRASGVPASFVLAGLFMSNFFQMLHKKDDTYTLAWPVDPENALIPLFDVVGDTGNFVTAAIKRGPSAERILAASEYYTPARVLAEFSEVTGHKVQAVQIPADVFKGFLPPAKAQEMLENILLLEGPGYYGGESLDASHALLDRKPTSWRDFVAQNKEQWP